MNIVRNNLKKHGVKFLKKDKKLETLTIKTEIGTKKKFLEYVDLYSRAQSRKCGTSRSVIIAGQRFKETSGFCSGDNDNHGFRVCPSIINHRIVE